MANEISWAALTGTAEVAEALAATVRPLLGDPTDLRAYIPEDAFAIGGGAGATRVGQYDAHHAFEAATSEIVGSNVTNASIGAGGFLHTLANYKKRFQVSDLNKLVAPRGGINLDLLAIVLSNGVGLTYTMLACDVFASITATAGSTTTDMSVDYFFDSHYALNLVHAPADRVMVVRPKSFNEFVESLRSEAGALQYSPDAVAMLSSKGAAYKGNFLGTDIHATDYVDADGGGTYYQGAMFQTGGLARQAGPAEARAPRAANVAYIAMGELLMVFDYDPDNALEALVGHLAVSVVLAENNRCVELRSQVA